MVVFNHVINESGHIYAIFNGLIQNEADFRRIAKIQVLRKLTADIAFCTFQPFNCGLLGFLAAKDTDKCLAGLKIRCNLHSHDRCHGMDAGILDLTADNVAQFFLNFCIDPCIFNAVFSHFLVSYMSAGSGQRKIGGNELAPN